MNEAVITLKNIPGALDRDKNVIANGQVIGTVFWGWQRLGGSQWVGYLQDYPTVNASTLDEIKSQIARHLHRHLNK